MDVTEQEKLYLDAKKAYYEGDPIMTDDEFDRLEEELKLVGSDVVEVVGDPTDRNAKFSHLSLMGSLGKAQAALDGTLPIEQMEKWFDQFPEGTIFEDTPKFDGNAVNIIYRRGKLERAISRGNGKEGRDITRKVEGKIPADLGVHYDVEVRAEVVIPMPIFLAKYASESKNARNFVAGILNRTEDDPETIAELEILAIEVRAYVDNAGNATEDFDFPPNSMQLLEDWGFVASRKSYFTRDKWQDAYHKMKYYRENDSPYPLDGMVIKAQENLRKTMGATAHHPVWAIAIKFPPKEAVTGLLYYDWNVGTTGEITPVCNFEPVDLDGTMVKRAAGFNYGYLVREKVYPGCVVSIAKAGDIIPQIQKVIKPGDESKFEYPKQCPKCSVDTVVDGIHLWCPNDECEGKLYKKFLVGVRTFQTKKFGGVTVKKLYDVGFRKIHDIFDKTKFNEESLIATGEFTKGKTLDYLLAEIDNLKSVPLFRCILSLQYHKCGTTASKQIAKMVRGQKYSYSGLIGTSVEGWNPGEPRREALEELLKLMELRGIAVESEPEEKHGIGYEMTGSPKEAGWKVKSELEAFLSENGYVKKGLKDAKILLTDSLTSSSSKMGLARKLGVEIREYGEFVESIKSALIEDGE